MKKKTYGTLAALSALTASLAMPATDANAQSLPRANSAPQISDLFDDIDELSSQCDYIWDNRTNFDLLTEELNRILNDSPNVQTCDQPLTLEMRQTCQEQCTGLILALLEGDPVAQIPPGVDPY